MAPATPCLSILGLRWRLPLAALTLHGGALYGTASYGGSLGYGTLFKVNTDGTGFRGTKNFNSLDGANPYAFLTLEGVFYGATSAGGTSNYGTLFKVNPDGSNFIVIKNFFGTDGRNPFAGLIPAGTTLCKYHLFWRDLELWDVVQGRFGSQYTIC